VAPIWPYESLTDFADAFAESDQMALELMEVTDLPHCAGLGERRRQQSRGMECWGYGWGYLALHLASDLGNQQLAKQFVFGPRSHP
jgi:hypothetical protein